MVFPPLVLRNGGQYLIGRRLTYVDLSIFQIIEGLRYGFPKRMKRFEKKIPGLVALHGNVLSGTRNLRVSHADVRYMGTGDTCLTSNGHSESMPPVIRR